MKFQHLAIIFLIIIIPISVVINYYIGFQIDTLNLQTTYDARLINATYDGVKAFQMNTFNNTTSDVANSKISDIKASANVFFSSLASNFSVTGYNADTLNDYVPALVYTLYDGYYIYSKFDNISTQETNGTKNVGDTVANISDAKQDTSLKPYVYYSCRYKRDSDDFVITYSLDNYIRIQGIIDGKIVNDAGYLIRPTDVGISGNTLTYRGIEITGESLSERYGNTDFNYIKSGGTKYYLDTTTEPNQIFYSLNAKRTPQNNGENIGYYKTAIENNCSAYLYYKEAKEFSERVFNDYDLDELTWGNAFASDGTTKLCDVINDAKVLNANNEEEDTYFEIDSREKIFDKDEDIEDSGSKFNQHRREIIKYTIQSNLSIAIANYNSDNAERYFQMPKLKEDEWDNIINNISVISFLQSIPIGGKIYNGYAIVSNNLNNEFVNNNAIYISDGADYFRVNDESLLESDKNFVGYLNIDFQKRMYEQSSYYYPRPEMGSYTSIINSNNVVGETDVFKYVCNLGNNANEIKIKKAYFTALAREKYGMFKIGDSANRDKKIKELADIARELNP